MLISNPPESLSEAFSNRVITPGTTLAPRSFVLGAPARRLREVAAKEMDWIVYSWKAYVDLALRHGQGRRP